MKKIACIFIRMKESEHISIRCADQSEIAATLYTPDQVRAAIMIAPATGIRRPFYSAFAQYLAENGYGVITFDNSGIGGSLKGHIRHSKASLQRWGEIDMPAVLEALKAYFPGTTYHLVGHSAGGQLAGLMHNANELSSMFNFACSSGCIANMQPPFWYQAIFFMNVFIPVNNFLFGYTNAQWMNMGEPLPKMVAQQWKEWCNGSGYVKTALGKTIHRHLYDELDLPSFWLNATDDDIANDKNVDDMIRVYTRIKAQRLVLHPEKYGMKEIGHMKFFSKTSKETLWPIAFDWFNRFQREAR